MYFKVLMTLWVVKDVLINGSGAGVAALGLVNVSLQNANITGIANGTGQGIGIDARQNNILGLIYKVSISPALQKMERQGYKLRVEPANYKLVMVHYQGPLHQERGEEFHWSALLIHMFSTGQM